MRKTIVAVMLAVAMLMGQGVEAAVNPNTLQHGDVICNSYQCVAVDQAVDYGSYTIVYFVMPGCVFHFLYDYELSGYKLNKKITPQSICSDPRVF